MKKLITILLMGLFIVTGASARIKYTKDAEQLPEAAVDMLDKYFPDASILTIKINKKLLKPASYTVVLKDASKITFNSQGRWKEVNCNLKAVPDKLIGSGIRRYLEKNYPNRRVVKITSSTTATVVKIYKGPSLEFNKLGAFKGIVDESKATADDNDDDD